MYQHLVLVLTVGNLLSIARPQSVDLTLVPDASGEDVVDASIAKLEALNVFSSNFGLLKRIALVETNFGVNVTYTMGGIWHITAHIFSQLSNKSALSSLVSYLEPARMVFGPNVTNFNSSDFRCKSGGNLSEYYLNLVPLKSALAARLYLQLISGANVPVVTDQQANWWAMNYRPQGNAQDFVNRVTSYENTTSCSVSRLDIWLLIDGSGSIGSRNFQTTLEFVANLASEFLIAPDAVRFGFSVYSSTHWFISNFNQDTNNTEFNNTVLSTFYPGGGTNTGRAINDVVMTGFNVTFGQRPLSAGVPRILIVLTDGQSGDSVAIPSNMARDEGIVVYAVGIGSGIDHTELVEIGGALSRVFELDDFSQLLSALEGQLRSSACTASAEIPDNTTVEVSVPPGNTYYSSVQLPNNGSAELEFHVPAGSGSGIAYISGSVTNPNSAVYDFSITVSPGTTTITINAGDLNLGLVLAGVFSRSRRAVDDTTGSKPLYVALQSTSDEPLQVGFQSTGSPVRAAVEPSTTTAVSTEATTTAAGTTSTRDNLLTGVSIRTTSAATNNKSLSLALMLFTVIVSLFGLQV